MVDPDPPPKINGYDRTEEKGPPEFVVKGPPQNEGEQNAMQDLGTHLRKKHQEAQGEKPFEEQVAGMKGPDQHFIRGCRNEKAGQKGLRPAIAESRHCQISDQTEAGGKDPGGQEEGPFGDAERLLGQHNEKPEEDAQFPMDSEMNRPREDGPDCPDIIRVVPENAALEEEEAKSPGKEEERRQMPHRLPSLSCRHYLQDGTTGGHSPHKGPKLTLGALIRR